MYSTTHQGQLTPERAHAPNGAGCARWCGPRPRLLRPNLEHDLAARVSARDPLQGLANLLEGQHRLDLGAQLARFDQPADRLQHLPVDVGVERLTLDAASQVGGSADQEDRPAVLAHRADGSVPGLAASSVEEHVDADWPVEPC